MLQAAEHFRTIVEHPDVTSLKPVGNSDTRRIEDANTYDVDAALDSQIFSAFRNLGVCFRDTSETELAERHFLQALEWNPSDVMARMTLADLYLELGNGPAAQQHYQTAVSVLQSRGGGTDVKAAAYAGAFRAVVLQGDSTSAAELAPTVRQLYDTVLQDQHEQQFLDERAVLLYVDVLQVMDMHHKAISVLEAAVNQPGGNTNVQLGIALATEYQNDLVQRFEDANRIYQKLINQLSGKVRVSVSYLQCVCPWATSISQRRCSFFYTTMMVPVRPANFLL